MVDAGQFSHLYSEDDLKAVTFYQRPIIPPFKASPVAFQCIGETDPFLAVDNKLDNIGTLELRVAPGEFVGHLTG